MTLIYYIIETGSSVLCFTIFPLFGFLLKKKLSSNSTIILLLTTSIFFAPVLVGYSYVFPFLNELLFLTIISCIYALLIKNLNFTPVFIAIAFVCLLGVVFLGKMSGTLKKIDEWNVGKYKVEYFEERGFSGGPLLNYRLSKYTKFSFFLKELEVKENTDTLRSCKVEFKTFTLDKCTFQDGKTLRIVVNPN